jgi:hypothetical protein
MKPTQLKALQAKSRKLVVRVVRYIDEDNSFIVVVGSNSVSVLNRIVTVRFNRNGTIHARCTCAWAEHGGVACSHVIAALSKLAARKHRALRFWSSPEEAQRQKHTVFRLAGIQGNENIWITSRNVA